jgi:hypothetical protein
MMNDHDPQERSSETPQNTPYSPAVNQENVSGANPSTKVDATPRSRSDNWVWGIALIVLGGLFLLQNLTPFRVVNWWAIFILIPAVGSFATAWRRYRDSGRLSSGARNALFGGMIFTTVALLFLLNLDLGKFWPIFVIAGGLAVMVNALLPD